MPALKRVPTKDSGWPGLPFAKGAGTPSAKRLGLPIVKGAQPRADGAAVGRLFTEAVVRPPRVARYGCVAGVCLPEPVQLPVSTAVSGWAKVWVASAFPPLNEFLK